ncbi:MAG: Scr1 family TA system antitoxin-like transcriptional regulator, partial [Actinomadura sp.]
MANDRMTPRLFLANELRRARETKGMTPAELAKEVVVSESLVRAWEKGRRVPNPADLMRFEEVCDTGGVLGRIREDLVQNEPAPEWMGRWMEIERQASSLLTYQPLLIPGLLQTPAYAREVIISAGRQVDDAEAQVQARMDRQKILAEENSVMFVAVM